MSFDDTLIFPETISMWAMRGKRMRRTEIVETFSGHEQRNVAWSKTRRSYDAGMCVRPVEQWLDLDTFFERADGMGNGFRLKDPTDYQVSSSEGLLRALDTDLVQVGTIGLGRGVPTYQMFKRYTISAGNHDREIRKPIDASATIYRNGSPVTVGSGAGQVSINYNTGIVTFVSDVTPVAVTAIATGSTTLITTTSAVGSLAVGEWMYLTDFEGADAATLNNRSFEILSIDSDGVYELDVDTDGQTITRVLATKAYEFPQPADALTWAGEFHVPVRFATDELDWAVVNKNTTDGLLVEGPSVPIIEIRF